MIFFNDFIISTAPCVTWLWPEGLINYNLIFILKPVSGSIFRIKAYTHRWNCFWRNAVMMGAAGYWFWWRAFALLEVWRHTRHRFSGLWSVACWKAVSAPFGWAHIKLNMKWTRHSSPLNHVSAPYKMGFCFPRGSVWEWGNGWHSRQRRCQWAARPTLWEL